MKRIFIIATLLILSMGLFAKSYVPDYAKDEIMTVDKIQRDMVGYGLTVFQGVTIEKFDFKVLGVMKGFNRGHDVIYVELSHPRINRSNSAVIQGMSGSPCYINGKLVGAVALGYGFAKENVCMLTPIEDMFEAWDPNLERQVETDKIALNATKDYIIPVTVSGLTPKTLDLMSDSIKAKGFALSSGNSYGSKENMPDADKATIEPGSSVGVTLIDGDIVASSTGTVTYKKGNKILAFGHPMDEIGLTDVPMSKAYIVDIFSSLEVSRKISNPLEIVGSVYMDRSFSIAGEIGRVTKQCPVSIRVKDLSTKREMNLNCKVPAKTIYFNSFAPIVILEGVNRCRVGEEPTNGEFTYNIELMDGSKYTFKNYYTSQSSIADQVLLEVLGFLDKLNSSKYGIQKVKSINVEGTLCDGNKFAYIERVFLNKNTFNPGDEITLGIEMRKYGAKDTYTEYKKVQVPLDIDPGKLAILVYGGILADAIDLAKEEASNNQVLALFDGKDNTKSFGQYFTKYLKKDKNNELVVKLVQEKGTTLVAQGESLTGLPDYMKMLFSNTNNSVIKTEPVEYKTVFTLDNIPMGLATIVAPVEQEIKVTVLDNNAKALFNKTLPHIDLSDKGLSTKIVRLIDELDEAIKVTSKNVKDEKIESVLPKDDSKETEPKKKEEEKKEEKKSNQKILSSIKEPLVYEYKEPKDFAQGIFKNCNIGNDKILPTVEFLNPIPVKEQLATTIANTKLGYIVGTGLDCSVAFLKGDKLSDSISLEGLWVSSICEVGESVYVATNPGSNLYKLTDKAEKLKVDLGHKYISSMIEFNGKLLIGFSDSDELVLLDDNLKIVKKINHKSVFTTKFVKFKDIIYVGTKDKIISLTKDLTFDTVINNPGGVITTLSVNSKGDIYAYVATKNIIIKKDAEGINKIVPKAGEIYNSFIDDKDTAYFVGRNNITKIYSNGDYVTDKYTDLAAQFSAIVPCGKNEAYVSSTNPGYIFKINLHPRECVYSSPTIDFGDIINIKNIKVPCNNVEIFVGDKYENARLFDNSLSIKDFRIFINFNEDIEGELDNLKLQYYMPNRPPVVDITSLKTNDVIKGKKKIEWIVTDPDKDSYTIKIYSKKAKEDYKLIYPNENTKIEPDKEPIKSFEIDTETLKDGIYDFKVVACDILSNPKDYKEGVCEVKSVIVKNQGPELKIDQKEIKCKLGEEITITGSVSGKDLMGVEYSLGGEFMQVEAGSFTKFSFKVKATKAGENTLIIRAVDEYENHSDISIKMEVSEK